MPDYLSIDLETYSPYDIKKCGAFHYAEDVEILLFGFATNGGPVEVIEFPTINETMPQDIEYMLTSPEVIKTAFNAMFEFTVLSKFFKGLSIDQWQCTALHSRYLGLPGDLAGVSKVMWPNEQDKQKMSEGKALINYFCKPCKPTKANGGRTRNLPEHAPEKWAKFIEYNRQDVEVERALKNKFSVFPVPEIEQRYWQLDYGINARGVLIDPVLVKQAIAMNEQQEAVLLDEARELTGLENPNSVAQLKPWLESEIGVQIDSLSKDVLPELMQRAELPLTKRVIELRQQLSKTSVKKYEALKNAVCTDGRLRGVLQFYGASRTGRWAGRIFQPQNLPRISMEEPELDAMRELVKAGDFDNVEVLGPPGTLSQLIRTALVARPGNKLIVCDLSAIEARVIAWLAGESWRLNVFRDGGDIYCASAGMMFHCTVVKHGENGHLRQKGKIAELALGYGGSVGALTAFGADKLGMTEEEMKDTVKKWRTASPNIVAYWWLIDEAAKAAIRTHVPQKVGKIAYIWDKNVLFCQLPSGRRLAYNKPRLVLGKFDNEVIEFEGQDQTTGKWSNIQTYGPKLVENIVQAVSRDILAEAIAEAEHQLIDVVLHVHDEIVCEVPEDFDKRILFDIMTTQPKWADGLPLNAEAQEAQYYCK